MNANGADTSRSGRRSGRVALAESESCVATSQQSRSAPESITGRTAVCAAPDRAAVKRAVRVSQRRLQLVSSDLSARDRAVLDGLAAHRFLTTGQLQALYFADHATTEAAGRICRRVLRRLAELRIIEHLERRVGGVRAGSASYVWRVGPVGDRLLQQAVGDGIRRRRKEPSWRYLDHCLAIADCHLALLSAARGGQLELLSLETEPTCWRSYLGPSGSRETLKPDLHAVTASGDYEHHWFIEVDRSTESLPTVLSKCAQYERYRRLGREQHEHGVFPLVIWVVPDSVRASKLATALQGARRLDRALFRITTMDALVRLVQGGAS